MNKSLVRCEDCGKVYAARFQDGEAIVPTNEGTCECGGDSFVELPEDDSFGDDGRSDG